MCDIYLLSHYSRPLPDMIISHQELKSFSSCFAPPPTLFPSFSTSLLDFVVWSEDSQTLVIITF